MSHLSYNDHLCAEYSSNCKGNTKISSICSMIFTSRNDLNIILYHLVSDNMVIKKQCAHGALFNSSLGFNFHQGNALTYICSILIKDMVVFMLVFVFTDIHNND